MIEPEPLRHKQTEFTDEEKIKILLKNGYSCEEGYCFSNPTSQDFNNHFVCKDEVDLAVKKGSTFYFWKDGDDFVKDLEVDKDNQKKQEHCFERPTKQFDFVFDEESGHWEKTNTDPSDWDYVIPIDNGNKIHTYVVFNKGDRVASIVCYGTPEGVSR